MNKTFFGIAILLFISMIGFCQEPVSKISLSANLIGFALYGPITNIEFGVEEDVVINIHLRFPEYGLLTHKARYHSDGLDDLGGLTVGGGLIKFFGRKRHRPFGGILFEYDQISTSYGQHQYYEWARDETTVHYLFNLGYRFLLKNLANDGSNQSKTQE